MQERDVIVLPRKPDHVSKSQTAKLTITKTLEFSSHTLRSGVVVMADDALPGSALLFIRGAPGIIKDLVQPSSVPADFEQYQLPRAVLGCERDGFSSNSFRLMAMAVGVIPDVHQLDLLRMTQQQVEAHVTHMELLCLMVLTNNIRPDSKSTITELQDGGGIRTMMITGDYHHTAIAVARDVGMLIPNAQMIIIDIPRSGQPHADPQGQSSQGGHPHGPAGSAQGLFGEAPGRNAGGPEEVPPEHSLEAQHSIVANCLGHTASWADEEGEGGHLLPDADAAQSLAGLYRNSPDQQQPLGLKHKQEEAKEGRNPAGPMVQGPSQQQPLPEHRRRRSCTLSEQETGRPLSAKVPHDDTRSDDHMTFAAAAAEAAVVTHQPAAESPTKPIKHAVSHRSSLKRVTLPPLAQPTSHTPLPIVQPSRKKVTIRQSPATEAKPSSGICMSPGQGSNSPEHPVLTSSSENQSTVMSSAAEEEGYQHAQTMTTSQGHQDQWVGSSPPYPTGTPSPDHQTPPPMLSHTSSSALHHKKLRTLFTLSGKSLRQPLETPATPGATLGSLKFIQAEGNLECEAEWALTALAEGQLQCTVTGDAFDHVLQLGDTSLLESVMRNAVVFARMKPHQKGQVVDLLSATGIHQLFDGQPRHIQGSLPLPGQPALLAFWVPLAADPLSVIAAVM
ncbi:TPA: hypothetical protein ACH3X1_013629 [Trebouxia sp. C0004]